MERTLIYKNHKGDMITFTYKPPFLLSICDGFHETVGTVNSVSSAYGVGTTWNGTSIGQRDLTIKGTITDNIQENRLLKLINFIILYLKNLIYTHTLLCKVDFPLIFYHSTIY